MNVDEVISIIFVSFDGFKNTITITLRAHCIAQIGMQVKEVELAR